MNGHTYSTIYDIIYMRITYLRSANTSAHYIHYRRFYETLSDMWFRIPEFQYKFFSDQVVL